MILDDVKKIFTDHSKTIALILAILLLSGIWIYYNVPRYETISAEPIQMCYKPVIPSGFPPETAYFINGTNPSNYDLPQIYNISRLTINVSQPFITAPATYTAYYDNDTFDWSSYLQQGSSFNDTFIKTEGMPDFILTFHSDNTSAVQDYASTEGWAPIWCNLTYLNNGSGNLSLGIATDNQSMGLITIEPFLKQISYNTWEGKYYLDTSAQLVDGSGYLYISPTVIGNITFSIMIPDGYTVNNLSGMTESIIPNGALISETLSPGEVFDIKVTNTGIAVSPINIGSDIILIIICVLIGVLLLGVLRKKSGAQ
jgi:hypothetical protein